MDQLFLANNFWLLVLIAVWTLPWKGVALWRAAKREDKWWFIPPPSRIPFGLAAGMNGDIKFFPRDLIPRKKVGGFIIMLIINTIGILEITYIFYFSERKKKMQEPMSS